MKRGGEKGRVIFVGSGWKREEFVLRWGKGTEKNLGQGHGQKNLCLPLKLLPIFGIGRPHLLPQPLK